MTNLRVIKDGNSIRIVENDSVSTIESPTVYILTIAAIAGFGYIAYKMLAPIFFL
jgi:hypothetical protein